jgi:serine/threonine protein phosphatase PrpC
VTDDRTARSVTGEGEALEIAGITDRGPVRTQNQDVWDADIGSSARDAVLALADGMGGHKGGLESAEAAVTAAMGVLNGADSSSEPAGILRQAVAAANAGVATARETIGGNPGTTLVLAIVRGMHASVANVGDSRAYLVSRASVTQITDDHSWAAGQVRLGIR